MGWADVNYHRNDTEMPTPTIDALVKAGVELNRHYVHMMCTPSRASLQSGRLPVHVLTRLAGPCDGNGAIPRNITGIAAKLKKAGYRAEQQAFAVHDLNHVIDTYLPAKLENAKAFLP